MRKESGNIGDLMAVGLCVLALSAILLSYMDSMQLIQQKMQVGQLARKYILRMETVGMLGTEEEAALSRELTELGVTDLSLVGSTNRQVEYGEEIVLQIQGKLGGDYEFTEKRVSTAKY